MLLGKRPRAPMRRTTSLTEFSHDLLVPSTADTPQHQPIAVDHGGHHPMEAHEVLEVAGQAYCDAGGGGRRPHQKHRPVPSEGLDTRYLPAPPQPMTMAMMAAAASSRYHHPRRNSVDFPVETAHFLRACGLCKRRLGPGRDTFMYRGEIAFCSLECRQQQIALDERTEKCSLTSRNKDPSQATSAAKPSSTSETAAAA